VKTDHFFNFADEGSDEDGSSPQYLEEGVALENIDQLNDYYA
jgi:hypothetical protein